MTTNRDRYTPGAASGASIHKEGEKWTLVVTRDLRHPPAKVWKALTEPEHLREWAPFDSIDEPNVKRSVAPKALEYTWGGKDLRWELEPLGEDGTRLTLWHNIDRNYISMGAAGWHICFDVLEHLLAGDPIGRIVGQEAMKFEGWQRLHAEYKTLFGATP